MVVLQDSIPLCKSHNCIVPFIVLDLGSPPVPLISRIYGFSFFDFGCHVLVTESRTIIVTIVTSTLQIECQRFNVNHRGTEISSTMKQLPGS